MDRLDLQKVVAEAIAIETEDARKAGKVGYMARALVQATLPHKATAGNIFTRRNGAYEMSIMSPNGLPYGSIPRLLLSWVTTEAVRTRSPVLVLGSSLSSFMAELNLLRSGGARGDITRVRKQTERLFSSMISCRYQDETNTQGGGFNIAKEYNLWWNAKNPHQLPIWKSTVTLGTDFFNEIIERPVPIDMAALMTLKRSPMALDTYFWLTYRLSYLQRDVVIPWPLLQMQFGADYAQDTEGLRNFKKNFLLRLKDVLAVYDTAKVHNVENGLLLKPSPPHVAKLPVPDISKSHKKILPSPIAEPSAITIEGNIRLKTETFEKAKQAARGFDIYYLEQEWREWIDKKGERPKNPDAAFIGFCRRKAQKA